MATIRIFGYNVGLSSGVKNPRLKVENLLSHRRKHYNEQVCLRFYKFLFQIDQSHLMEVCVHKDCGAIVEHLGEDYIDYCPECGVVCEGYTEYMTAEEQEKLYD